MSSLLFLALVALSSCGGSPEAVVEVVPDPPTPVATESPPAPAIKGATRREIARLEERVLELDLRLLETEGELLECQTDLAEAKREAKASADLAQKMGSEAGKAMSDLFDAEAALAIVQMEARSFLDERTISEDKKKKAWVRAYVGPHTSIVGDQVVVDGELWNGGDAAATVSLGLELYAGDRIADSATISLRCPSGVDTPYRHVFRHRARDGVHYSTRIDISY